MKELQWLNKVLNPKTTSEKEALPYMNECNQKKMQGITTDDAFKRLIEINNLLDKLQEPVR
jgi:hypothetical protein